jgi:hypothetical protein
MGVLFTTPSNVELKIRQSTGPQLAESQTVGLLESVSWILRAGAQTTKLLIQQENSAVIEIVELVLDLLAIATNFIEILLALTLPMQ